MLEVVLVNLEATTGSWCQVSIMETPTLDVKFKSLSE